MKNDFTFNGRQFRKIKTSTIEHDLWLMTLVRDAGLDEFTVGQDEKADEISVRLLREVLTSGKVFPLMGGLLIPAQLTDVDWTPEIGSDTADFLRKMTAPEDKKALQPLIIELLLTFFQTGVVYLNSSRTFSSAGTEAQATSTAAAMNGEHSAPVI